MNVEQARQIIKEAVTEQVEICKKNGFTVSGKVYFSDKALRECTEFNENIILISLSYIISLSMTSLSPSLFMP